MSFSFAVHLRNTINFQFKKKFHKTRAGWPGSQKSKAFQHFP